MKRVTRAMSMYPVVLATVLAVYVGFSGLHHLRFLQRADPGFYCWEQVEAYRIQGVQFILSARNTSRGVDELKAARWQHAPRTDADEPCECRTLERAQEATALSI